MIDIDTAGVCDEKTGYKSVADKVQNGYVTFQRSCPESRCFALCLQSSPPLLPRTDL